jgi:hypothetical protein
MHVEDGGKDEVNGVRGGRERQIKPKYGGGDYGIRNI